jgi:hypothetical protein
MMNVQSGYRGERERKGRANEEQRKNKIEQNECCLMNIKKHTFSP